MSGDCGHGWGHHSGGPSSPCDKCTEDARRTATDTPAVLSEQVRCNWTPYGMVPANGGAWVQHHAEVSKPAAPADARDAYARRYEWLRERPITLDASRCTPVRPEKLDQHIDYLMRQTAAGEKT